MVMSREVLPEMTGLFDAWYLDGFAPVKNPEMWAENIFPQVAARTKPGGTVATFSATGDVKRGLRGAGFTVKRIKGFGTKWHMTMASLPSAAIPPPAKKPVTVLGAGPCRVRRRLCAGAKRISRNGRRPAGWVRAGNVGQSRGSFVSEADGGGFRRPENITATGFAIRGTCLSL